MELRVPKRYERGLVKLIQCPESHLGEIFAALERARPALLIEDLARQVASQAAASEEDVRAILEAIAGLYVVLERGEADKASIADAVVRATRASDNAELRLEEPALGEFRDRLIRALSFEEAVGITAKALDVKLEQERTFCTARVLTDLRPVFPIRSVGAPAGFLVGHTLRIRYHEGGPGEGREFCVAVDRRGLDDLITALERAKRKEDTLKVLLRESDLPVLESGNGGD